MTTLQLKGKKYVCNTCSHQETVEYKNGALPTPVSLEEYDLISSQQEIQDDSESYMYELDSICDPCFNKMIKESEEFEFEVEQAEAEQENILTLMKSRDLIDRDFWEKMGGEIVSSIEKADLGFFKQIDPEKFHQYLKLSDGHAGERAERFWESLNQNKTLADWMQSVGMDSDQVCLQWLHGGEALQGAVDCCLGKVDGFPLPMKLDFQKGDAFGDEQAVYRYPAKDQPEGYFVSLVEARAYIEQQLEFWEAESSYRAGIVEIFKQVWIERLRVLLKEG
ncbi:MAG: hypothetical protein ACQER7_12180 [Bacteroidota bacterium]